MTIHVSQDVISTVIDPLTGDRAHIYRFTLVNDVTNMYVQIVSYGAAIYSLKVADNTGKVDDVVMGFELIKDYVDSNNPYFGATIGRVCNRLSFGSFFVGTQEIQLSQNLGIHHLHGGKIGFDKIPWRLQEIHKNGITFSHLSPNGHEGYPGDLFCTVRYTMHEDNSLRIYMTAKTTMPTIVNMTNHSYFNLAGHKAGKEALFEHDVTINAEKITHTKEEGLPTGIYLPVDSTPYDFRYGANLGERMRLLEDIKSGFDDNFIVVRDDLGPKDITKVARVVHEPSGRWMEVFSNQKGLQFYTGNHLPDEQRGETPLKGRESALYRKHGAFCLETQGFPDAPNHIHFPSIRLLPGEKYEHWVTYKFGTKETKVPIDRSKLLAASGRGNVGNLDEKVYKQLVLDIRNKAKLAEEEAEKAKSSSAITKQEKQVRDEVQKDTAAAATAGTAVAKGKEDKVKGKADEEDEQLQGACGGEPKKPAKE